VVESVPALANSSTTIRFFFRNGLLLSSAAHFSSDGRRKIYSAVDMTIVLSRGRPVVLQRRRRQAWNSHGPMRESVAGSFNLGSRKHP
jgi:hypothetical protein